MNTLSLVQGIFHEFGINLLRQVVCCLKILFLQAVTPCSQSINTNLKMNNVVFKSQSLTFNKSHLSICGLLRLFYFDTV